MTPPGTDHRAHQQLDRADLSAEPVQGTASRVNSTMADSVIDETRERSEKVDAPDPIRESDTRFGDEAVPLRPTAERAAEIEGEEVVRLVAAVSSGESPLQRRGAPSSLRSPSSPS